MLNNRLGQGRALIYNICSLPVFMIHILPLRSISDNLTTVEEMYTVEAPSPVLVGSSTP